MLRQQGQQRSKKQSAPTGPKTAKQTNRRARFIQVAAAWATLSPQQRTNYTAAAVSLDITGWNLYLSEALRLHPPGLGVLWDAGAAVWDNAASVWL